jgi:hypothetical protein
MSTQDGVVTKTAGVTTDGRSAATVVVNGIQIPAGSTPEQRFATIAKAAGVKSEQPASTGQFHTQETLHEFARRDAQAAAKTSKAVVPAKVETPPAAVPVSKPGIEGFYEEMTAKGLTVEPTAAERVEQDVALLSSHYRLLVSAGNMQEETRARFFRAFQNDLAAVYGGKPLTDQQRAALSKSSGNVESLRPTTKDSKPTEPVKAPEVSQFTPAEWAEGHKSVADEHGGIPMNRLNPLALSGYTLKTWFPEQTVTASVFSMLASARKAGLSQSAVDQFVEAELRAGGWIK